MGKKDGVERIGMHFFIRPSLKKELEKESVDTGVDIYKILENMLMDRYGSNIAETST